METRDELLKRLETIIEKIEVIETIIAKQQEEIKELRRML